jgi:predicted GNAT family acetyltransferase
MTDAALPPVIHNRAASRFEVQVDGSMCVVEYRLSGQVMHMTHTLVPSAVEGRGIAAHLVRHALEWARQEHLKVDPICSYVRVYMKRHPDTLPLMQG